MKRLLVLFWLSALPATADENAPLEVHEAPLRAAERVTVRAGQLCLEPFLRWCNEAMAEVERRGPRPAAPDGAPRSARPSRSRS